MNTKELKVIADAMLEKKGQDVVSLDLKFFCIHYLNIKL